MCMRLADQDIGREERCDSSVFPYHIQERIECKLGARHQIQCSARMTSGYLFHFFGVIVACMKDCIVQSPALSFSTT